MELYELPEAWSDLGPDELRGLVSEIQELAAAVEDRRAGIDLLESYAGAVAEIRTHLETLDRLAAAEASLSAQLPEPAVVEPVQAEGELATTEVEAEVVVEVETEVVEVEESVTASTGVTRVKPVAETIAEMNAARAASERPRIQDQLGRFTAAMSVDRVNAGDSLDVEALAAMITSKRNSMGNHSGDAAQIVLASSRGTFADDRRLSKTARDNDVKLRAFQVQRARALALAASGSPEAMAASGGPLAPVSPTYGFFNPSSVQSPLQSALARFEADRAGIRFTPPPSLADVDAAEGAQPLSGGITIGATDGSTATGVVTVSSAPAEELVLVQPVSKRVRFDNLNYRVYPEQVEYMLDKLVELESRAVEIDLLEEIQTQAGAANATTGVPSLNYGAFRHLTGTILSVSHWKRKTLNMNLDDVLEWILPDTVVPALAADMVNDGGLGANFLHAPLADIKAEFLRRFKLNIVFNYYDATGGSYPASAHMGAVTTAKAFPAAVRGYVMAPGSVGIVDGGEQNFGMMRDSTLNGTNDVELFSERWLNLAHIGTSIEGFDMALATTGVAPAGHGSFDPSLSI